MRSIPILVAAAAIIAAGGPAPAQAPARPTAPAAQQGPPPLPGVSAQGNAVIQRLGRQGDPVVNDAVQKLRALVPQISQTATAPVIDIDKFAAQLKQQNALTGTIQAHKTDLIVAILRQLPPADRGAFLRAVATQPPGQGQR